MSRENNLALAEAGVTLDDEGRPHGFLVGKAAALSDWLFRKEQDEFKRLVWRVQAQQYWARKTPEQKEHAYAYRRQWAKDHPESVKRSAKKSKAKYRQDPTRAEAENRRAKRRAESAVRRAATVYECDHCGSQWSPVGRIPCRPPRWCSIKCRNAHTLEARRAAGQCFDCRAPAHGKIRCATCQKRGLARAKEARARKRS